MKEVLDLFLFDTYTQTTTLNTPPNDLSPEMKTYYHDRLIDNAEPELVYDQFGASYPIPKNGGKTIEFRKYDPLPKALTPITEGITPAGNKLNVTTITATINQYGDYIQLSDLLELTAIDRNVEEATKLLGSQAGRTLDTITREVVTAGTNVIFAPSVSGGTETPVTARKDITTLCELTPKVIRKAASSLKRMNAKPIDDSFVAVIHPDIACDLQGNTEWIEAHKYATPENIYNGEIGKIAGVRFVESTEAKIYGPQPICGIDGLVRTKLNANVSASTDIYPVDVFSTDVATAVNARISAGATYKIYVNGAECTVASVVGGAVGTCKIVLSAAVTASKDDVVCGFGAGKDGSAVYATMVFAANAYGKTEVSGGGLQHIVKQLGYGEDPLNQRSSTGWKATKTAERLVEAYMIRIEHSSGSFGATAEAN